MSENAETWRMRKNVVQSPFLLMMTLIYAVIFVAVFQYYAYAEPGGFPVFYSSGELARFDLRGLYSQHLQDVFHPANRGTGYFFHLPYEIFLLVPLSFLPQTLAYGVWSLLNLACLLGLALILRRHFPNFEMLLPFAFAPTLALLLNGQDIGIVALLIALAFDRFVNGKDIQAGAFLALGLFKFPLIIPPAMILAFRYRKVLIGFLALSVPVLVLSALMMGKQGMHDYLALTQGTDQREAPQILINLRGAIGVLFGSHTVAVIALSLACVALAASIRTNRISMFSIAVISTLLVGWHTHLYDAVLLVIPMAWMAGSRFYWIKHMPTAFILLTAAMLANSAYSYILGIFLFLLLPFVLYNILTQNPKTPAING